MTFYVTFGQKYRTEAHPYGGHPDGWSEVQAPDIDTARAKVFRRYGQQWCWIYSEDEFPRKMFPIGMIERII